MNKKGQRIISLRKQGKTYGEIEKILNLPKSTVGWWLRGVKMKKSIEKKTFKRCRNKWSRNISNYNKVYAKIRSEEAANDRENHQRRGYLEIKNIMLNDLKLIGNVLYWAEGNTKNRHLLRFANSKPEIIKVMMKFFREVCKIPEEKIKARVHLYPTMDQNKAINYWKKIVDLPKKNFHPSQIQISRASKNKRPKNTLPYGTLHLTAGNTEITCKVKGWIEGISEQVIKLRV
ncbi:hypothetical protein COU05_01055 [bacterium (Candidatus Gribaldobacteria) CG10_big_fil_rev_8_21_14_0_10_37_21]|uniref:Uncharacterized protein n=1 Tax=bacterium (Candidatus Gribaldobacteria) CG10_big_fil_rev_8_21_14_0_10_37_21 TaxID=2014275 RepID=A0A2H0UUU5_9BACT|nr:MAG: hypothetical protein AUJ25_02155 [Parcubacteria group bacterium CG1_02_37_13]PIR90634.1 MAG: hypothetical protein COU05_01055 [bacterium (Candidatus Gribaldobacteria) CG10_big_fil_rev_8_21_14_0_10_37_21]